MKKKTLRGSAWDRETLRRHRETPPAKELLSKLIAAEREASMLKSAAIYKKDKRLFAPYMKAKKYAREVQDILEMLLARTTFDEEEEATARVRMKNLAASVYSSRTIAEIEEKE
jgi:hypothetical protein